MRLIVSACVAVCLIAAPACATPIVLNLDDGAQSAAAQLPSLVDNCVSALMLRNDPSVCRTISMWVMALEGEVKKAQAVAAKKALDDAAVAKKAAEDAAIAKKMPEAAAPVDKPEPTAPE